MKLRLLSGLLTFFLFPLTGCNSAEKPVAPAPTDSQISDTDWIVLSTVSSPLVRYSIQRIADELLLRIAVDSFKNDGTGISLETGLSADKTLRLSEKDAKIQRDGKTSIAIFRLPASKLVDSADGWKKLRVALSVEWAGIDPEIPRLRERFLHVRSAAAHAGLSEEITDWQPVDLDELAREAADRALEIAFDFSQPVDGKATIVIETADGQRIRNLVSSRPLEKGNHRIVWDGIDETGNIAPPGDYRWRSISHPGLSPAYQMSFADGPGSNHGTFETATTNGNSLFFGAPVAEGGHEIVELSQTGEFLRGFNPPHGHGLGGVALAADEKMLYAAHDGMAWGAKVDRSKPDWKEQRAVTVMRIDLEKGSVAEFSGNVRFAPIKTYEMGPGSAVTLPLEKAALTGLVLFKNRLFLSDQETGEIHVIDPATGQVERKFPLASPVAIAASADGLFAISENRLIKLDPATGAATSIAEIAGDPTGLHVANDGRFYLSDGKTQTVQVLDAAGKPVATIGKPGGPVPGKYDPAKIKNPTGLVTLNGQLWVTEKDRWQPKRLAAFDLKTGEISQEYFGPTAYGAPGAGFDDQDHTRWIGQNTMFQLNFKTGKAKPVSILGGAPGRRHRFWRQDGRTFIITSGKATYIQELLADGTMRRLACFSSAHQFAYDHDWKPPLAFVEAFQKAYPEVKYAVGQKGGIERGKLNHGYGMLWVDRNGDGAFQTEEFEFATAATNLGGAGWSHDFYDLTMKVPGEVDGKKILVTLKPNGFWPGGTPKYPPLNDAVKTGIPIDLPGTNQIESIVDRFGNLIMNSDPAMRSISREGKLLWTYPNRWSNVHGSHDAPLPKDGELQGVLFYSGIAKLDEQSDVIVMNGNHGRAFFMTSDGLYLDEIFSDVRLMNNAQASGIDILGGECFGGTFGHSEKGGNYYFQGGGISYRIYRVDGLRETKRNEGKITVSTEQTASAERNRSRQVAAKSEPLTASVSWRETPPVIDGNFDDWKDKPTVEWKREEKFPVTCHLSRDAEFLYLHYLVKDDSPWVNNGKDWQSLFKTGDGIDLQLATDPNSNPKRTGPVPGDLRLFIAPSGEENIAVLYRHRVPGAKESESVIFQSPWRSEKVDVVERLSSAKIAVQRENNGYRLEAAIPLSALKNDPANLKNLLGDFGVIYGDSAGTQNVFRNYWSNRATGLVNDVPGEIMLSPNLWSEIKFAEKP